MDISSILNNRNVILLSIVSVCIGIALTCLSCGIFDGLKLDANKAWDKALKFNETNAEEFPYSVKTQQGGLYAKGEVIAVSELLKDDRLDGEFMAIQESFEEYRMHTEYYSCNCHTINDLTTCDTCTRTYWSWDLAGTNYNKVEKVSLLGQEIDGNMFPWDTGNYESIRLANGDYHYYYSSHKRSSFYVVTHSEGRWGFVSDENGFRYDSSLNGPKDGMYEVLKWVVGIFIMLGTIGLGIWNIYENYESFSDNYI